MDKMSPLLRRAAVKALFANRPDDMLVVTGLGSTTWDVASLGETDRDFYLWGAMGGAAMVGLGIALAQPDRKVVVVTGDGEMLMGLGSLATVAQQKPRNLAIVVFDNGMYGETGMQPSATHGAADLVAAAAACGIARCFDVRDAATLHSLAARLPALSETVFARIAIAPDDPPRVLPERDGQALKRRFRKAISAG